VIACVNQECSHGTNHHRIGVSLLELAKIQTVETNKTSICPNPEIAIGSLCYGRYRSARPTSLSSPRVVEILRHGPSGIDRKRRSSEAESRESGDGTPE
jgi:hypothetical protein